jgi:hypothetical protein
VRRRFREFPGILQNTLFFIIKLRFKQCFFPATAAQLDKTLEVSEVQALVEGNETQM